MARKKSEVYVFSHIGQADGHRFVPSGILGLTETSGANVQNRELASEFAYGTGYLERKESFWTRPGELGLRRPTGHQGQGALPGQRAG
jgi:serine/threonine-protein kinase HipA